MNNELYNKLSESQNPEIVELYYDVSHGKVDIRSYIKKIELIDDKHFTTIGYGYNIELDDIQKWRMNSWSSNSYSYRIFLLKDESIDNYVTEIKNIILKRINKEIEGLQKSIDALAS